jgi:hypothetical protein
MRLYYFTGGTQGLVIERFLIEQVRRTDNPSVWQCGRSLRDLQSVQQGEAPDQWTP